MEREGRREGDGGREGGGRERDYDLFPPYCNSLSVVVCLGMIWDSAQPTVDEIMGVVLSIGLTLQLNDVSVQLHCYVIIKPVI